MLSRCFLDFSVGVGAFVTGLSQISSSFSYVLKNIFGTIECSNIADICAR